MEKKTPDYYTFNTGKEDEMTIEWIPEKGKMPPFNLVHALSRYADDISWVLEKTKDQDDLNIVIRRFKGLNKILSKIIKENYGYITPKNLYLTTYYIILKESDLDMDQFRSLKAYIPKLQKIIDDSRKKPIFERNWWRKTIEGFYPGEVILHRLWWLLDNEVRQYYHKLDLLDCVPDNVDIKIGFRSDDMMTEAERSQNKSHKSLPKDENGHKKIPSEKVMRLRFLGNQIEEWYEDCQDRIFKYEPKRQLAELKKIRKKILNLKNDDGSLFIEDVKDTDFMVFPTKKRNYYARLKNHGNEFNGIKLDLQNLNLSWEEPISEDIAHDMPFALFALYFFWGGLNYEISRLEDITSNDTPYVEDEEKQPVTSIQGDNNGISANVFNMNLSMDKLPIPDLSVDKQSLVAFLLNILTQNFSSNDNNN